MSLSKYKEVRIKNDAKREQKRLNQLLPRPYHQKLKSLTNLTAKDLGDENEPMPRLSANS